MMRPTGDAFVVRESGRIVSALERRSIRRVATA